MHPQLPTNTTLDEAIVDKTPSGDSDLLLRLRAVDSAITFLSEKTATLPQFHETYTKIYQFLKNEQQQK